MADGISKGMFVAGLVVAILVSSGLGMVVSSQLSFGPKGDKGDTGETGTTGATGSQGQQGIQGVQGPQGDVGPQGEKGDKGDTGGLAVADFDSGWIDIADKNGQYFNITHGLNSADVLVDITGKTTTDGGVHQKYFGLGYIPSWSTTYGSTAYSAPAYSIVQTTDGGYAFAGYYRQSGSTLEDFWLVKTDSHGNWQWEMKYGKTTAVEQGYSLIETSDGGFALAGITGGVLPYDFWLVKTDQNGNMQWNKTYGGTGDDRAYSLIQTADGGYAIAGSTNSYGGGGSNFWLVRTDSAGTALWNSTFVEPFEDICTAAVQTLDGGYALAGTRAYLSADSNFWLVRTNSTGGKLWDTQYNASTQDFAYSMVQTGDGGFALAGATWGAYADAWLVKTYANGTMQWNKKYSSESYEEAHSLVLTRDGGYIMAGNTASFGSWDVWLLKTDAEGTKQWDRAFGETQSNERGYSVVESADGGYVMLGQVDEGSGNYYAFLVKTDVECGLAWTDSYANSLTLYRGADDVYWNYVRVRIWKPKTP